MSTIRGTYRGDIEELKGETALLRPKIPTIVLAQFDNLDLDIEGVSMSHNWHEFPASDFEILKEPDDDQTD